MSRSTRRDLLRRGGAALSGGLACLLAGCNGTSEGDPGESGNRTATYDVPDRTATPTPDPEPKPVTTPDPVDAVEFGTVSFPATGPPDYRRWVPAPSELPWAESPDDSEEFLSVQYADFEWIRELGSSVPSRFVLHRQFGELGLDHFGAEEYRRVVRINGRTAVVVEATFDRPEVARTLTGTGYDPAGDHRGYRLFARDDDPRAVAVGDDALVFSKTAERIETDPANVVRAVVDAGEGATARYHEVDDDVDHLWRAVGSPPTGTLFSREHPIVRSEFDDGLEELIGGATTFGFDTGATYWGYVLGFDRPAPESSRESLRRIAATMGKFRDAATVEVTIERRQASIIATVPDDRYVEAFDPPYSPTYPQITWSFDHEQQNGPWRVTATHEAGDEVSTNGLAVNAAGTATTVFAPGINFVDPGDSLTIWVDPTHESEPLEISLNWKGQDLTTRLGRYEFP